MFEQRIPFESAIDMRLRLVSPPIAKIAAWFSILESQKEYDSHGRNSPLEYELHRDAKQFPIEKTSKKERQGRDQQNGDEIFVLEIEKRHSRSEIAINRSLVQCHRLTHPADTLLYEPFS
jgi:hypothetical protein